MLKCAEDFFYFKSLYFKNLYLSSVKAIKKKTQVKI